VVKPARANGLTALTYYGTVEAAQVAKEDGFKMITVQGTFGFTRGV